MAERPSLAEVLNIIGMNDPKHLPYFGPILVQKLTALYAKYPKTEAEAAKAERERWATVLLSWINHTNLHFQFLTEKIAELREGK